MRQIWIEKYRPSRLEDVVGNTEAVGRLRNVASNGNMPNILLAGPPGTGKTTSIICLARELLGPAVHNAVMELNASDERGIDTVRDKIKTFAKEVITLPPGRHKIVVLDEVDSMTETAQQALRRLMELHSDTTRFALACNQSTKVIEPIQSRCAILRFTRLTDDQILKRLIHVCQSEKVEYVDSGLDALIFTAEGDMRNALNNLQSTVNGFGCVDKNNVLKITDMPPPESVRAMLEACHRYEWREAHHIADGLLKEGYTPGDICAIIRSVLKRFDIPEHLLLEYLKEAGRCHYVITTGCSSAIQIDKLLCNLCTISRTQAHDAQK